VWVPVKVTSATAMFPDSVMLRTSWWESGNAVANPWPKASMASMPSMTVSPGWTETTSGA
jgi:hypothetical protein